MSDNPYTLTGRAGDTFTRVLTHTEDDDTPINLTGCSVEWSLRSGNNTEQWVNVDQAQITNAAAGEITLTLTPTETRELAGRSWAYEVTITFSDDSRTTILYGFLSFSPEVVA